MLSTPYSNVLTVQGELKYLEEWLAVFCTEDTLKRTEFRLHLQIHTSMQKTG